MAASLLEGLALATLMGSLGVIMALALRVPLRGMFGSRVAYAVWAIPGLMVGASLLPGPRGIEVASSVVPLPEKAALWVLGSWLLGAVLVAAVSMVRHLGFLRRLGRPSPDADGLPILRAPGHTDVGPAVVGAVSPRIVVPANFNERYSDAERAMVLAHERSHLFGHDVQAIAASVVVRCLNWFNPLAHLGGHFLRIDQELACDASVLTQYPTRRRTYAEALLKTQFAGQVPTFGCQWPSRGTRPLEQRIALLGKPERSLAVRRLGGGLVAGLAILASAFAWAAEAPRLVERPPATIQLWAGLKDNLAFVEQVKPAVLVSGASITRVYEVSDGDYWQVTLTPSVGRRGRIAITADVRRDGRTTGRQSVVLEEGEPRTFRVGERNLLVTAKVAR